MNNSNLPYTHEDFIKFSVEIHLDELLIYNIPYIKTISYALTQPRVHEVDNTPKTGDGFDPKFMVCIALVLVGCGCFFLAKRRTE